jgi:HD domain
MTALLDIVRGAHPGVDTWPIERAHAVAARVHDGQLRKSGDPYITHLITVATIVAEIGMSPETICAALLHDTVEDTDYSLARLSEDFGEVVANIVDVVTKLDQFTLAVGTAEAMRDMVLATTRDPRVLVVKLADRLHNMRTIRFLPPKMQARKARETLEVFAPLAHQLGMTTIKRELDDLATGILSPALYEQRRPTVAERALAASILLLPSAQRVRWLEEWTGELAVLPTRRARARFAGHMLRGMPRFAMALRRPATHHTHRLVSTVVDKIAGALVLGGVFLTAVARGELAVWTVGAIVLGGLVLSGLVVLGGVLFARSDVPANRLRAWVRAWRDPVSTARSRRRRRNRPGPL